MMQYEAVVRVMEESGGYATLGHLYEHVLDVPGCEWKTKTPFASIRRIVQVYPDLFFKAFGTRTIDSTLVVKAIAQFERTMISSNSKWDRYLRGEVQLTQAESKGFEIFFTEKGDCFHCHTTILFTDHIFHNNGLDSEFADKGLFDVTGDPNDMGKFKTPTLRNLEFTAPYMHDGRFETLEEVIDFYSHEVKFSPTIDPLMKKVQQGGIQLTDEEKESLLAFLKTLTDNSFNENPDFSNPFENEN